MQEVLACLCDRQQLMGVVALTGRGSVARTANQLKVQLVLHLSPFDLLLAHVPNCDP
jgi:hypothetical protein